MDIDQRLDRLTGGHEVLTQSVELFHDERLEEAERRRDDIKGES